MLLELENEDIQILEIISKIDDLVEEVRQKINKIILKRKADSIDLLNILEFAYQKNLNKKRIQFMILGIKRIRENMIKDLIDNDDDDDDGDIYIEAELSERIKELKEWLNYYDGYEGIIKIEIDLILGTIEQIERINSIEEGRELYIEIDISFLFLLSKLKKDLILNHSDTREIKEFKAYIDFEARKLYRKYIGKIGIEYEEIRDFLYSEKENFSF